MTIAADRSTTIDNRRPDRSSNGGATIDNRRRDMKRTDVMEQDTRDSAEEFTIKHSPEIPQPKVEKEKNVEVGPVSKSETAD